MPLTLYHYALKRGQLSLKILRYHVKENNIVVCRYLFGSIVNLLPLELLVYPKPLEFLVGSINMYGIYFIKFTSSHNSPSLTFLILVLWNSSDVVIGFYITSTYLSVYEKYCVIVSMKLSRSTPSYKILTNRNCIIL